MEVSTMIKTLATRCRPSKKQEKIFLHFFSERAKIWNLSIDLLTKILGGNIKENYSSVKGKHKFEIMKFFRDKKNELFYKHCKEVPSAVFECAVSDFFKNVELLWKDSAHIRYRTHKQRCSCTWHRKAKFDFGSYEPAKINAPKNLLHLPGIKDPLILAENIPCERIDIKEVTIKKKYDEFYAFIAYEVKEKKSINKTFQHLGIDWGVKTFLTCFDGKESFSFDFDEEVIKKKISAVNKANEMLSKTMIPLKKKNKFSKQRYLYQKNYFYALKKLNKARKKMENYKDDCIKQTAFWINKNYDSVTLESISGKFLQKSRASASTLPVKPFYKFKRLLTEKFDEYDKKVYKVPFGYPSTQKCSNCGRVLEKKLTLSNRVFICPNCGYKDDRDINAAKNLFQEKEQISQIILQDPETLEKREYLYKLRKQKQKEWREKKKTSSQN